MLRQSPKFASTDRLEPTNMRLGSVLKLVLPVLTAAFRQDELLTVGQIEVRIDTPTAGVRRALSRLSREYVASPGAGTEAEWVPVLEVEKHPTDRWTDSDGHKRPVGVLKLSPAGYEWGIEMVESLYASAPKKRSVLNKLMRLADPPTPKGALV